MIKMRYMCFKCGNNVTEEINIEGFIHHGRRVVCFNNKECNKRAKKKERRKNEKNNFI